MYHFKRVCSVLGSLRKRRGKATLALHGSLPISQQVISKLRRGENYRLINKPFVQRYKTKENHYIYDVNSNRILGVDEITFNLFDCSEEKTLFKNNIISLGNKYGRYNVKKCLENLKKIISSTNLFQAHRPKKIRFAYNQEEIQNKLNTEITKLCLNVTNNCNLRCDYCPYSGSYKNLRTHSYEKMNVNIAKSSIDYFMDKSINRDELRISFYGGEPLLNFRLIKYCVNYVKNKSSKDCHFYITTNGTLLKSNTLNFFIENNFHINVSIDGPSNIHNRYRKDKNGKGTFLSIIENLKELKKAKPTYYKKNVGFNIVLHPPYDLNAVNNFFIDSQYSYLFKTDQRPFVTQVSSYDNTFLSRFSKKEKKEIIDQTRTMRKIYIQCIIKNNKDNLWFISQAINESMFLRILNRKEYQDNLGDDFPINRICLPGQHTLFVSVDGHFYPCERIGEYLNIGDVKRKIIFNKVQELIKSFCEISSELCPNCWAIRFCYACHAVVIDFERDLISKTHMEKFCKKFRKRMLEYLVEYSEVLEKNPRAFDKLKNLHSLDVSN